MRIGSRIWWLLSHEDIQLAVVAIVTAAALLAIVVPVQAQIQDNGLWLLF